MTYVYFYKYRSGKRLVSDEINIEADDEKSADEIFKLKMQERLCESTIVEAIVECS